MTVVNCCSGGLKTAEITMVPVGTGVGDFGNSEKAWVLLGEGEQQ